MEIKVSGSQENSDRKKQLDKRIEEVRSSSLMSSITNWMTLPSRTSSVKPRR